MSPTARHPRASGNMAGGRIENKANKRRASIVQNGRTDLPYDSGNTTSHRVALALAIAYAVASGPGSTGVVR